VVLLFIVVFIVDIFLIFFFFVVVFIIITRVARVVASRSRGLGLLVLAVLKLTIQLRRLVILPTGWA
jgi:hypothetical protein